jgi:hypothetical protein
MSARYIPKPSAYTGNDRSALVSLKGVDASIRQSAFMSLVSRLEPPRWDIDERIASIEARTADDLARGYSTFTPGACQATER